MYLLGIRGDFVMGFEIIANYWIRLANYSFMDSPPEENAH